MLKTLFDEAKERKAKKQVEKDKKAAAGSTDVKMQPQWKNKGVELKNKKTSQKLISDFYFNLSKLY